jgi:hypothetical protein
MMMMPSVSDGKFFLEVTCIPANRTKPQPGKKYIQIFPGKTTRRRNSRALQQSQNRKITAHNK